MISRWQQRYRVGRRRIAIRAASPEVEASRREVAVKMARGRSAEITGSAPGSQSRNEPYRKPVVREARQEEVLDATRKAGIQETRFIGAGDLRPEKRQDSSRPRRQRSSHRVAFTERRRDGAAVVSAGGRCRRAAERRDAQVSRRKAVLAAANR